MLPSKIVDLSPFPRVQRFVEGHLDMQFDDVRSMMKLPRPYLGMRGGCNFAAAATLCNLIGGMAEVLFTPPRRTRGTGPRFVSFLKKYYPWQPGEDPERNARIVYDLVRNPLVHSLGVGVTPEQRAAKVTIVKTSFTESQLRAVERSPSPPRPSLAIASQGKEHTLWLVGLYWGVLETQRRLFSDLEQMAAAEQRLKTEGWDIDA